MDEFTFDGPRGRFEGLTLRLYEAVAGTWSLYWATPQASWEVNWTMEFTRRW